MASEQNQGGHGNKWCYECRLVKPADQFIVNGGRLISRCLLCSGYTVPYVYEVTRQANPKYEAKAQPQVETKREARETLGELESCKAEPQIETKGSAGGLTPCPRLEPQIETRGAARKRAKEEQEAARLAEEKKRMRMSRHRTTPYETSVLWKVVVKEQAIISKQTEKKIFEAEPEDIKDCYRNDLLDEIARRMAEPTVSDFASGDHFLATYNDYHGWSDPDKPQKAEWRTTACMAYVTSRSNRYHHFGCRHLKRTGEDEAQAVTVDYAVWCGLEPCSICNADEL